MTLQINLQSVRHVASKMRFGDIKFLVVTVICFGLFQQAVAQEILKSDYVVVDPQKLQIESALGQEIGKRLEAERLIIVAGNEVSSASLEAEEAELTRKRDTMPLAEFTPFAVAFDKKTEFYREKNVIEVRNLNRIGNMWFSRFFDLSSQIIKSWSEQNDIKLVLNGDSRTGQVFWSDPSLDISPIIVQILDNEYKNKKDELEAIIFSEVENLEEVPSNYTSNGLVGSSKAPIKKEGESNEQ